MQRKEKAISSSSSTTNHIQKKKRAKREKRIKKRKQTFSKYFLLFAQIETALLENLFDFCFHGELRASSNSVRSRKRLKKKKSQKIESL